MCGIVGIAARMPVNDRSWLGLARQQLAHRGPDDAGEWWSDDGRIGLAHRRLSIIDLTAAGRQPMVSPEGDCRVVYNGEIYNYRELRRELSEAGFRFRSESDTEVVLAAYRHWGTDCLDRLNGMFAFALYDAGKDAVFMARDRAGEKPLYYACLDGELRFASELKGLLADKTFPRRVSDEALDCFLAFGYVPGDLCIFDDVAKLPPAHALLFDAHTGQIRTWRYWAPPRCVATAGEQMPGLVDRLETLLADAVSRQLVADVPVGVLLSGGVDSSLVTAFAARAHPDIKTFTVRFPGHGHFDETEHARLIAGHLGTEHVELESSSASPEVLAILARAFDEPMADSSMVPTFLVSRLVAQHCKVVLGGDGGDELFGGYGRYSRFLALARRARFVPPALRKGLAAGASRLLPAGFKGRNLLQQFAADWNAALPTDGVHFDAATRRALVGSASAAAGTAESVWRSRTPPDADITQRATRMDFENYLAEKILVKVDRASMANSLEVRAPFLDRRVVEFAFADVPAALKVTAQRRKILPAALAARVLPGGFDTARKQGFSIPLAAWLRAGSWRDFFREVLTDSGSDAFSRSAVNALLKGQDKGRANSERLFALVMFELWRREYRV